MFHPACSVYRAIDASLSNIVDQISLWIYSFDKTLSRAQFNAAKKKMIQMRKDKEQELFKEQQQMRGRMADRLAKEYREIEVTK